MSDVTTPKGRKPAAKPASKSSSSKAAPPKAASAQRRAMPAVAPAAKDLAVAAEASTAEAVSAEASTAEAPPAEVLPAEALPAAAPAAPAPVPAAMPAAEPAKAETKSPAVPEAAAPAAQAASAAPAIPGPQPSGPRPLQVLAVASEIFPLIKTGGLADVVGGLPSALAHHGVEVRTLVPGYPSVLRALEDTKVVADYGYFFGASCKLLSGRAAGLDLYVLESPQLFWREGNPYSAPDGQPWPDNPVRFAALAHMGYLIARGDFGPYAPDILHAHDWQAALAPAYLHYGGRIRPRSVLTIHNLAFQGQFSRDLLYAIGLPGHAFSMDGVEYYGGIGYLKAGIRFADRITTVSPRYAVEICRPGNGMGLDGLLRQKGKALSGIVNGIDVDTWNPADDPALAATYTADTLERRAENKAALEGRFGLLPGSGPLIGIVSRLSWQKGIDIVVEALPAIMAQGCRIVALGTGDAPLEKAFAKAVAAYPGRIGVFAGYDEKLAHLVQGGADAILVPSRFEPCGLTQLYGLRYGCLPIVSRVGGLFDTVIDSTDATRELGVANGIQFDPVTVEALEEAIDRFVTLYADTPALRTLQRQGMSLDLSWTRRAAGYAAVFRSLVDREVA
jgi:starch synthase